MAEQATMALIGGGDGPEKASLPESLQKSSQSTREQELVNLIENGSREDALAAIRELAAMGGALNRQRFNAIMIDPRWPNALRTEAALALLASPEVGDKVRAARGLALIGGSANVDRLVALIDDPSMPTELRLAAALSMEIVGTPRARDVLLNAFSSLPEPAAHEQLLGALGKFPFRQIEEKITQVLDDPTSPESVRVAAVDALAGSSPDALPFLKAKAESDQQPRVREMAAWAISALPAQDGAMGPELARMAAVEPEVDVRRRLYEALPTQAVNPAESLLPQIQNETDLAARVAGFSAIGDVVGRDASSALATQFDSQLIPELTKIAVSEESVNIRMRAVFAIRRADTPAAQTALQVISQTANAKVAQAAQHGLKSSK